MKSLKMLSDFRILAAGFLFLFMAACGGNGSDDLALPGGSTDPGTGGSVSGGTPTGVVSNSGFWIDSSNSEYPTFVNSGDGFGNDCLIAADEPLQNKKCYIDILELDLYMNAVDIQYNVPPNMCQHLGITPSWHWNESSGRGPTSVNVTTTTTDTGTVVTSCTANRGDGTGNESCMPGTGTHPEIINVSDSGAPTCIYDRSSAEEPNCCFGEYMLTVTDNPNGTTVTESDWGGDIESCIGGPVRAGTGEIGRAGYPVTEVFPIPSEGSTGLNGAYTLEANGQGPQTSFSYPANFYTTTGSPHTHTGFSSTRVSTMPYAFDPVDDLDGSPFGVGLLRVPKSDGYLFECLDEAYEVRYSFEVYIREWNTVSEYLLYGSTGGTTYNPDVVGVEGVDCEGISGNCNDRFDFDDILSGNGGVYDTGAGVDGYDRRAYFPRVEY